jgi:hypothetical protein
VPAHPRLEHVAQQRPQGAAVPGGDEVDRPAHEHDAHRLARLQQRLERRRVEVAQARPQPEVRRARQLRLHAGEPHERVGDGHRRALAQQLALQGRAVERAGIQHVVHARDHRGPRAGTTAPCDT